LGSEYLNIEFGWKPFVQYLQKAYKLQQSINSKLAQLIRDNNKPVRRKVTLKRELTNEEVDNTIATLQGYPYPFYGEVFDDSIDPTTSSFKCAKTRQTSEEIWAIGRSRYYIPDVTDDQWSTKAKLALFGLNPTPSLLWQVMPWSWLIDWFSNVGDVIANLSSNGIADLTYDYAYLMRHRKKVTRWDAPLPGSRIDPFGNMNRTDWPGSRSLSTIVTEEHKERIAATPFGFGLQLSDLSVRQAAILAALGLSRSNF